MQFDKFYRLYLGIVTWFSRWHHLGYQQTLSNLGKHM